MKAIRNIIGRLTIGCVLACCLSSNLNAQTNLQFTAVAATDEHAIRLTWSSQSNEVYEIDEADALLDTNTGSITWNKLYDDYPSQGTNTFWLDTGNYFNDPIILHPKNSPMRFYRVVDQGPDTTSDKPTVSIVSPTNGFAASGSLTVTVAASTDQATLSTKLYVDGEEVPMNKDGSYVINTCEWPNGSHTLFATARCTSAAEGPDDIGVVTVGHGVSPFNSVTFSNLITRISFSQPFFNPAAGQTQQVSAVFAANCDWTLNIRDIDSNAVRMVTGSGTSLLFNWDGNGDGGTNIPAGVYYYYISAQTNGLAPQSLVGGSSSSSPSATSLFASQRNELYAFPTDGSGGVVPLALYPQGFDTNSLTIFPATQAEIDSLYSEEAESNVDMSVGISPAYSGASSQPAPPSPSRPPTAPVAGISGTFGIAYQTYSANGTNGYSSILKPFTYPGGQPPSRVSLEGYGSADSRPQFGTLKQFQSEANNFITAMQKGGWSKSFCKANDQLSINDLRGSGTPFNSVNLGVLMVHGTYGSTADYTASGCKQMYFPIASGTGAQYVRESEMSFGSADPNGLKWMAIMACFGLYHVNWSSMHGQNIQPYNSNLHLILGCDTLSYTHDQLLADWAVDMFGTPGFAPLSVEQSWYDAGSWAYNDQSPATNAYPIQMIFAASGNDACLNDTLQTNSPPTGSYFYNPTTVYTPH